MKKNTLMLIVGLVIVASMVLAACQPTPAATPAEQPAVEEPVVEEPVVEEPVVEEPVVEEPTEEPVVEEPQTTRHGGWADQVVFSLVDSTSAVTQIEAGAIDIYGNGLSSQDLPAIQEADLEYSKQNGLYYELSYNPVGPEFGDGKLNPFSSAKVREATNWLFDRQYLNQEIYAGGGLLKFFPITTQFPDYADMADVVKRLESKYAYNPELAEEVISAEMEAMGAELVDGKWNYNGEPVTIVVLIRNDSDMTRIPLGDYVANQFESIGFTTDRQYKTATESSPLWISGDPADGLWHVYTGAWSATIIDRDQGDNFQFFYDPASVYGFSPLWQAYTPSEEYGALIQALAYNDFQNLDERREALGRALELALEDSVRVWLIDGKNFAPWREGIEVAYDLAAGVDGSAIWPHTLRFTDQEGGQIKWGTPDVLVDPYNPIAGTNWAFDNQIIRAVQSHAYLPDPHTGLYWPLRMESGTLVAKAGLPIGKTLDWIDLQFVDEVVVPEDAYADWDAENQVFITVGEKYPDGVTANIKTVTVYPEDVFETVKWHDGSALDVADFLMIMIMTLDPAKPESAIYDESQVSNVEAFLANFRGFKIVSEDPLTVEFYTNTYELDAEINFDDESLWPTYTYGEAGWHAVGIGVLAEANGEVAFSSDKAEASEIEWTNYIGGPSLEVLSRYLDQAIADSYIPYAATLGEYITADEAVERYENLKAFFADKGHYWVGTGPYVLDQVSATEKIVTIVNNPDYPDLANRWNQFSEPKVAEVEVDGAGQSMLGTDFVYDVFVTFNGEAYAADEIKEVKALVYDATGEIVYIGEGELVEDGQYLVTIPASETENFDAGASKVEIAVVPYTVSIPTFQVLEFVTIQ